jgi:glucose/arabinose dehydrogenase
MSLPASAAVVTEPGWSVSTVPTPGLVQPTTMQFLGPDDFFILEKASGKVKRFTGGVATEVLDLPVNAVSERGLLGIELHPDFPATPSVYLYYSLAQGADGGAWLENRLSQFTWDGANLVNEVPLLSFEQDPGQENGANHDGGVLRFGPDGMLYGVTGDLNRDRAEQNNLAAANTSSDVGGIFRVRPDGTIPDGSMGGETANPFLGEANADFHKWYAYGVRNSFGAAFDPVTGMLWDTENGPGTDDEINLVAPGFNSGWNSVMGLDPTPGDQSDLVTLSGSAYSDPEFTYVDTNAVTGIVFLDGTIFGPAYDDGVLVVNNNLSTVHLFRLNDARTAFELSGNLADLEADDNAEAAALEVGSEFGAPTDLVVGPDGAIYVVAIGDGAVYRIVPEPAGLAVLALGGLALLRRKRR